MEGARARSSSRLRDVYTQARVEVVHANFRYTVVDASQQAIVIIVVTRASEQLGPPRDGCPPVGGGFGDR
eukprot:COSAG02_NODE_2655_length_8287_cov_2.497384_4_plen_70_part_00